MCDTEWELVRIAKRENNKKRNYLVVNRLQGKHIPVSPSLALAMFERLADLVREAYREERLLLIGFAETATAIGASLAVGMDTLYMQTTREEIAGVDYLYFSEAHSHATEQRLVKTDLDSVIDKIDRIIFVEDEVTTGNTILNIIRIIEETYKKKVPFAVASLLNGMDNEAQKRYQESGIGMYYLVKTDHRPYAAIAEQYAGDGVCYSCDMQAGRSDLPLSVRECRIPGYKNARRLNQGREYAQACGHLWECLRGLIGEVTQERILVVGTEECMYPALYVGRQFEEAGNTVRSHSTTRSPITVSEEAEYPLHERYELISLYERTRRTFLYEIGSYDRVLIITDAPCVQEGLCSLVNALARKGNRDITLIRWC